MRDGVVVILSRVLISLTDIKQKRKREGKREKMAEKEEEGGGERGRGGKDTLSSEFQ